MDISLGVGSAYYGTGHRMSLWLAQPPHLGGILDVRFGIQ
jgi:hypothetical protein